VKGGFLLDVVVGERAAIFELFSCEDQSLLLWWDAFFVLDFCLHVGDRVIWLDVQGDGFSSESLDKNLHCTTTKTKDKVKGGFLLDVVVGERAAIFELFSCEDQTLLLWRDAFLILDFCLHVGDRVVGLDVQSDSLSSERLDENLHGTTAESEDKVKSGFLLNVVV